MTNAPWSTQMVNPETWESSYRNSACSPPNPFKHVHSSSQYPSYSNSPRTCSEPHHFHLACWSYTGTPPALIHHLAARVSFPRTESCPVQPSQIYSNSFTYTQSPSSVALDHPARQLHLTFQHRECPAVGQTHHTSACRSARNEPASLLVKSP